MLDALVQLDAVVPAALLRPYYDRRPVQALALWSKPTPGRNEILLELLHQARNERWFAIANILLQTRVVGLAGAVIEFPLALHVSVTDPGLGLEIGISGGVAGGINHVPEPTDPYPPVPEYRFSWLAAPGRTVLSTGPRTLYYERRITTRWTSRSSSTVDGPRVTERVEYLAELAKTKFAAPPVISVAWKNAGDLQRRVRAAQISLRKEYDRVFDLLVTSGLLEGAEARRLTSSVEVHLADARTSKPSPLPAIGPLRR